MDILGCFFETFDFYPTPHIKQPHVWLTVPDFVIVQIIFKYAFRMIGLSTYLYETRQFLLSYRLQVTINLSGKSHSKNLEKKCCLELGKEEKWCLWNTDPCFNFTLSILEGSVPETQQTFTNSRKKNE